MVSAMSATSVVFAGVVAWTRGLVVVGMMVVLVGCATQSPEPVSTSLAPQGELVRFGRFALKVEDFNRAPEAVQGGFTWRDTGTKLTLDLTDPFGTVMARVLVDRSGAMLTRANGDQLQAASPDALMQSVLGQSVPVQGLRGWLKTMVQAPAGMSVSVRDPEGRIQIFEQGGWRVQLSKFDEIGPRLLVMTHSEGSQNINIRLVVDAP
jgi:outer membrane lipoprotein LolB